MVRKLGQDMQYLYRYGTAGGSAGYFMTLSEEDKKRLTCMALIEGDKDAIVVARHFLTKLTPVSSSVEELLETMSPADREEIEVIRVQIHQSESSVGLDDFSRERVKSELRKAIIEMGHLPTERAFWILLSRNPDDETRWVEATSTSSISSVTYTPEKEDKYALIVEMRKARWVLHIHNHPKVDFIGGIASGDPSGPSREDLGFAEHWRTLRPELHKKMLFFIIEGNHAVEYQSEHGVGLHVADERTEKKMPEDKLEAAAYFRGLALLYKARGIYAEAESQFRQALQIKERLLGEKHPDVAAASEDLAEVLRAQAKHAEAQFHYSRALRILERVHGRDHLSAVGVLAGLAATYTDVGKYTEAEVYYERVLGILERAFGPDDGRLLATLGSLGAVYKACGKIAAAETSFKRALKVAEKLYGQGHPKTAPFLEHCVLLSRDIGENKRAATLEGRLRKIREHWN